MKICIKILQFSFLSESQSVAMQRERLALTCPLLQCIGCVNTTLSFVFRTVYTNFKFDFGRKTGAPVEVISISPCISLALYSFCSFLFFASHVSNEFDCC